MRSGRKKGKKLTEVQHLRKKLSRCQHALKKERARWEEKCPSGHLVRYDECDVMCLLSNIDPTVDMPKPVPNSILHDWVIDDLVSEGKALPGGIATHTDWLKLGRELYAQFDIDLVERQTGWWIRYPRRWWLKLKGAFSHNWYRGDGL